MWRRKNKKAEKFVAVYPWVTWTEEDTEKVRKLIKNVFDKEPPELNSNEAGFVLGMLTDIFEEKNMVMVIPQPIAKALNETESISMNPKDQDIFGRKRYPEIVEEIGFTENVIDELRISF